MWNEVSKFLWKKVEKPTHQKLHECISSHSKSRGSERMKTRSAPCKVWNIHPWTAILQSLNPVLAVRTCSYPMRCEPSSDFWRIQQSMTRSVQVFHRWIINLTFRRALMLIWCHTSILARWEERERFNSIEIWTWKRVFGNLKTGSACPNCNRHAVVKSQLMDR